MVVVEDVVVGGVEAGLDAVPYHLTGPGRRLKLLDLQDHKEAGAHALTQGGLKTGRVAANFYLHPEEGDTGQEVHGGFEVLQPVFAASREVVLRGEHSGGSHTNGRFQ